MGASNFHSVNAYNTYAVLMNYEQELFDDDGEPTGETEYVSPDREEVVDFKNEMAYSIKEKIKQHPKWYVAAVLFEDPHELRSYPSTKLFSLNTYKEYGDLTIGVQINCVMRSGYHEGACLDWFITTTDDIDFDLESYKIFYDMNSDLPIGLGMIIAKHAFNWATKTKEELIQFIEAFFREHSSPLTVAGRFSNGETIYEKQTV